MCRNDPRATCGTCRWFDSDEPVGGLPDGSCSVNPPVVIQREPGLGRFPGVQSQWWCAQHEYANPPKGDPRD